jgi:hypothetical protein
VAGDKAVTLPCAGNFTSKAPLSPACDTLCRGPQAATRLLVTPSAFYDSATVPLSFHPSSVYTLFANFVYKAYTKLANNYVYRNARKVSHAIHDKKN